MARPLREVVGQAGWPGVPEPRAGPSTTVAFEAPKASEIQEAPGLQLGPGPLGGRLALRGRVAAADFSGCQDDAAWAPSSARNQEVEEPAVVGVDG